jgi:hypothetical protein
MKGADAIGLRQSRARAQIHTPGFAPLAEFRLLLLLEGGR